MPIIFRCPGCTTLNKVGDEAAGKAVRCGKCQAVLTVPAASPAEAAPAPAPAAPVAEVEAPRQAPPPLKKSRRREADEEDEPRPRRRKAKAREDEAQELPRPRNLLKARQRKKSRVGLIAALVGGGLLGLCGLCGGLVWYFYPQVGGADAIYDGGGPEAKVLPPLEDIRDGKFTRPPRTTTASYFNMVSTKSVRDNLRFCPS